MVLKCSVSVMLHNIHFIKPRTVPSVFVVESSVEELCKPGGPRCVLLGTILVRYECCFAVENLGRQLITVVWSDHNNKHITNIGGNLDLNFGF